MDKTIYTVAGKEFELQHYGVKGMKWGHRKARLNVGTSGTNHGKSQAYSNYKQAKQAYKDAKKAERQSPEAKAARAEKAKKAAKIGAVAVGTVVATYGAYKLSKMMKERKLAKNRAIAEAAERAWQDSITRAVQNVATSSVLDPGVKSVTAQAGRFYMR